MTDAQIEVAARTIQRRYEETGDPAEIRAWEDIDSQTQEEYREDARAVLSAVEELEAS